MKKQILLFFGIILIGGLASIGWVLWGRENQISKNDSVDAAALGPPQQIVHMTNNGFEPSEFEVRAGDIVQWVNDDAVERWPASDMHPTHGIYPEFDPQYPIPPGESWSFRFEKEGRWKFHDHLKPLFHGIVYVE